MKIICETTLKNFDAWAGAVETKERILAENKADEFESHIEKSYPDGITATELNDILWFNEEEIFDLLGIQPDSDESTDDQEEQE